MREKIGTSLSTFSSTPESTNSTASHKGLIFYKNRSPILEIWWIGRTHAKKKKKRPTPSNENKTFSVLHCLPQSLLEALTHVVTRKCAKRGEHMQHATNNDNKIPAPWHGNKTLLICFMLYIYRVSKLLAHRRGEYMQKKNTLHAKEIMSYWLSNSKKIS